MSYATCNYSGCGYMLKNRSRKVYKFPVKDKKRLQKWILRTGNLKLFEIAPEKLKWLRVCGVHFSKNAFLNETRHRLKNSAVPKHFLNKHVRPSSSSSDEMPDILHHQQTCQLEENTIPTNNKLFKTFEDYIPRETNGGFQRTRIYLRAAREQSPTPRVLTPTQLRKLSKTGSDRPPEIREEFGDENVVINFDFEAYNVGSQRETRP